MAAQQDSTASDFSAKRLGELLVAASHVTQTDVERALELQSKIGGKIGALLIRSGALSETVLIDTLAAQLQLDIVGQTLEAPSEAALTAFLEKTRVKLDWFIQEQVVAWEVPGRLLVTAKNPLDSLIAETLEYFYPDTELHYVLSRTQDLDAWLDVTARLLQKNSEQDYAQTEDVRQLRELAEEAPIVELVNNIFGQAVEQGASDIHVEPKEFHFGVRLRIDGVLHNRFTQPKDRFSAVVSRIKLISGIDIAERRLPQDGRMTTRVGGREMDVRVSTLPGAYGESVVMRLLPKEREELHLSKLGMLPDHMAIMSEWLAQPHGIVLVTGPTGSGKSTTLYASLDTVNDGIKKIITVEDPIEYQIANITQVQAHAEIGLTFAAALRSILRQDPDIILIGEMRDLETAEIAIQSSLTGHLVLSTLHTNDAVSAFNRLIDMGVEPFLVASPLRGVQAQRLVRRTCSGCSESASGELNAEEQAFIEAATATLFPSQAANWQQGKGCTKCQGTGYKGRFGIYELVGVGTEMQHLITTQADIDQMKALARSQGYRTMREDGLLKAWLGQTSVEEVYRVTSQQ